MDECQNVIQLEELNDIDDASDFKMVILFT